MFATGFSFQTERTLSAAIATSGLLEELARDTGAMVLGGRTVPGARKPRNVMTLATPGEQARDMYAKMKLFSPSGEDRVLEAGEAPGYMDWTGLRAQIAICYDLRFPEVFRAGLKAGATAIALGACWPNIRQAHWRALLIARAIENQCFVFACNRVGSDPVGATGKQLHYSGGSMVISPKGEVLGELGDVEGVLSVGVDAGAVTKWRGEFGAWRDAT
jgi:predicted amidohydrolase